MCALAGNLMRRTTTSPALVGSPTRAAIWIPLGKAGLSFQVSVSGMTLVNFMASCAIAVLANAIKAAATKNFFMLASSKTWRASPDHPSYGFLRADQQRLEAGFSLM